MAAAKKPAKKAAARKAPANKVPAKTRKPAAAYIKPGTSTQAAETRRKQFIEAFLANGGNATQAGITAGFSPKTAGSQGGRLLKDVRVQEEIKARRKSLVETMELSTERTLREVARIAYFDPRKLVDSTGRPLPITELDDDTAAAIAGLEVVDKYDEPPPGSKERTLSTVIKYKLADKRGALEMAMRHLGLYERDNKQQSLLSGIDRETLLAIREKLRAGV